MSGGIRLALPRDADAVTALALLLWPDNDRAGLRAELEPLLSSKDAAVFLYEDGGCPAGFAQCQLRRDYVEGTSTSPVGYLEGIFVSESARGCGAAAALLAACEAWAAGKGCTEFASDCETGNAASIAFHKSTGFTEANRLVCFVKELRRE